MNRSLLDFPGFIIIINPDGRPTFIYGLIQRLRVRAHDYYDLYGLKCVSFLLVQSVASMALYWIWIPYLSLPLESIVFKVFLKVFPLLSMALLSPLLSSAPLYPYESSFPHHKQAGQPPQTINKPFFWLELWNYLGGYSRKGTPEIRPLITFHPYSLYAFSYTPNGTT